MENIGGKIRNLRKKAGLSQVQLAELVERNPHTIKDYESGRVTPSWDATMKIAEALGVPQRELLSSELKEESKSQLSAHDLVKIIDQIATPGPTELEILRDTLDSLSKPILKKKIEKDA